jgi:hypothetical protein
MFGNKLLSKGSLSLSRNHLAIRGGGVVLPKTNLTQPQERIAQSDLRGNASHQEVSFFVFMISWFQITLSNAMEVRLLVDDISTEDHTIVFMNNKKMVEMNICNGDTILLIGKKGRDTVATVVADETISNNAIRMNKVVRSNIRSAHLRIQDLTRY